MATRVSELESKISFLKIWEVELRGTFWFLEGSCAMVLQDADYTSALCSCPLPFGVPFAGVVRAFTPVLHCFTSE